MFTYYLGQEEVTAYLRDFLNRLIRFDPVPEVWCALTGSGKELLAAMLDLVKDLHPQLQNVSVVSAMGDGSGGAVRFPDAKTADLVKDRSVLVFDGAVHSGTLLSDCVRQIVDMGAKHVCTYSLVIKRGTKFVPTIWGLTIDDIDRAFFLLDAIPNHRLDAGTPRGDNLGRPVFGHLRALAEEDADKPSVKSEVESIDRVTWGDRFFDMKAGNSRRCCYLLEQGTKIVGFVTLSHPDAETLSIDEVAVDIHERGKKFGPILIRFADTMARSHNCRKVKLNAISDRVDWYKKFGYELVGTDVLKLGAEEYQPMQKAVVYNRSWLH